MVGVWQRLNTAKPRKSEMPSSSAASGIFSSGSRAPSFSATPTDVQAAEIVCGKDVVHLKNGSFDLDLVFAPDVIERFEDADIIASKEAANRAKDRESLARLRAVRD
jgi:hypothetical protein